MALAVSVRIDFVDNKGKSSFTKVRLPSGRTLVDYKDFAEQICQLFLNVSTGRITRSSICFGVDLSSASLNTTPSAVSSVKKKAAMRWITAETGFDAKFSVPAFSESKIVSGSDDVDTSDADVIAFVDQLEDNIAVTAGTMVFTNGRGHAVATLKTAKERFRRRSAG